MRVNAIGLPLEHIKQFCERWKITDLALFGFILSPEAHHTLFDLVNIEDELKGIFQRDVDLVNRRGIERSRNYLRRNAILSSAQIIYAAWLNVFAGHAGICKISN